MNHQIICFGETLWDMLPDSTMPGGAPVNVAVHLKYHGYAPIIISRVGNDIPGKALVAILKEKGIETRYIQTDELHTTGVVNANVSNKTEITYEIVAPVAWDYIEYEADVNQQVTESNLFIYGSLASRRTISAETMLRYLQSARKRVFDVNLRPPHYTPRGIQQLMAHAHIIKMNHHELTEIMSWYGMSMPEKESMAYLRQRFNLELLLITRGENGAAAVTEEGYVEHPGFQVEVADTIGSGDAFLAAFLHQYLAGGAPGQILPYACAVGAFVATQRGATPLVNEDFIRNLIHHQILSIQTTP